MTNINLSSESQCIVNNKCLEKSFLILKICNYIVENSIANKIFLINDYVL